MKTDVDAIVALAHKLRFEVSPAVRAEFAQFFATHLKALQALQAIDTTGIAPLTHVDPAPRTNWREDVVGPVLPRPAVLDNAPRATDEFIVLPGAESAGDD